MNTDYARKNQQIANSFYNLGLEKARIRDLSGAAQCLKKSLHFNKYQTDARNLLGLIYYENGEVADALVQWVISLNLQPEDNLADHYLDEIQRKPGQLEIESQNVKTFNQALWHAQNGSDDLAILQLARVVESNPHFVKAHLLLALLYMAREDFNKAGRCLYKILQIDKSNQKALHYMSIVKQNTGRADAEKRKMVKAFSHRKMEDDRLQLSDNVNAREMQPDGSYQKVKPAPGEPLVNSQMGMYDLLRDDWTARDKAPAPASVAETPKPQPVTAAPRCLTLPV